MKFENDIKRENHEWAKSDPRSKAFWARRPTAAADRHGLAARLTQ
jgi:hypothetical protein